MSNDSDDDGTVVYAEDEWGTSNSDGTVTWCESREAAEDSVERWGGRLMTRQRRTIETPWVPA